MLTLEDLLSRALPEHTVVLSGSDNLSVEVTWAAALRSRPPAFEGLKGGELALVSVRTLRQLDDRLPLSRLIEQIAGLGVSAVAVTGDVNNDAIAVADRLGLPLVHLPEDTSPRELEGRVTRAIVERRAELQTLGQDYYHQLLELVIAGRGPDAVLGRLADLTGRVAALEDSALQLISIAVPVVSSLDRRTVVDVLENSRQKDSSRLAGMAVNATEPPTLRIPFGDQGLARVVAPVATALGREGYLSLIGPGRSIGSIDRIAVSRAAAAIAIDFSRERSTRTDLDTRLAELMDELVAGTYSSEAAISGRAARLGLDLGKAWIPLALRATDEGGLATNRTLDRLLRREFQARSLLFAVHFGAQYVVCLLPGDVPARTIDQLVASLRASLASAGGHLAGATVRPAEGVSGIRDAIGVAFRSLDLSVRKNGADSFESLDDLTVNDLIVAIGPSPLLSSFCAKWLSKLEDYDRKNGTELIRTLAAYFESHHSPTEAAERLHLHRNTLLYRLQRIREITGRDPDDPDSSLALHLAIRVNSVLSPEKNPG